MGRQWLGAARETMLRVVLCSKMARASGAVSALFVYVRSRVFVLHELANHRPDRLMHSVHIAGVARLSLTASWDVTIRRYSLVLLLIMHGLSPFHVIIYVIPSISI